MSTRPVLPLPPVNRRVVRFNPDQAIADAEEVAAEEARLRAEMVPGDASPPRLPEKGHCRPFGKEKLLWNPCEELDELEGLNFYLNFARTRGVRGVGGKRWPHSDVEVGFVRRKRGDQRKGGKDRAGTEGATKWPSAGETANRRHGCVGDDRTDVQGDGHSHALLVSSTRMVRLFMLTDVCCSTPTTFSTQTTWPCATRPKLKRPNRRRRESLKSAGRARAVESVGQTLRRPC